MLLASLSSTTEAEKQVREYFAKHSTLVKRDLLLNGEKVEYVLRYYEVKNRSICKLNAGETNDTLTVEASNVLYKSGEFPFRY